MFTFGVDPREYRCHAVGFSPEIHCPNDTRDPEITEPYKILTLNHSMLASLPCSMLALQLRFTNEV